MLRFSLCSWMSALIITIMICLGYQSAAASHSNQHVTLPGATVISGQDVEVKWHNLPGGAKDWITIVPEGSPDTTWGNWWYTDGKKAGSRNAGKLKPGRYEIRVYFNWPSGGYNVQSRLKFTVSDAISPRIVKLRVTNHWKERSFGHNYEIDVAKCSLVEPAGLGTPQELVKVNFEICRADERIIVSVTHRNGYVIHYDWIFTNGGQTVTGAYLDSNGGFGPSLGHAQK